MELGQGQITCLRLEQSIEDVPYLGRSGSVWVSKAWPERRGDRGNPTRATRSQQRASYSTHVVVEGLKGTSKYVSRSTRESQSSDCAPPAGGEFSRRQRVIQWLESSRQREDLKLVFNRRMQTRMYGGAGGVRSNAAPIPIGIVLPSCVTLKR